MHISENCLAIKKKTCILGLKPIMKEAAQFYHQTHFLGSLQAQKHIIFFFYANNFYSLLYIKRKMNFQYTCIFTRYFVGALPVYALLVCGISKRNCLVKVGMCICLPRGYCITSPFPGGSRATVLV